MTAYTDRLAQKASKDNAGPKPGEVDESLLAGLGQRRNSGAAPKTGPGQMLAYTNMALKVQTELEDARGKLKEYEGALLVKEIDPKMIGPSMWANRHSSSFTSPEFESLKNEIAEAGGNIQPIKVRPVKPEHASEGVHFEVVYGHRRHRACLELGLPVLAMIEEVDDTNLFVEMDRENRSRKDLSPFEQGFMYRLALDRGLFPNARQLAKSLGVDPSIATRYIRLASLPDEVLQAFESPCDVQARWASVIEKQLETDPDGVLERARALKAEMEGDPQRKISAVDVFTRLTTVQHNVNEANGKTPIELDGQVFGLISKKSNGAVTIELKKECATADKSKLIEQIREFIQQMN